MNSGPASVVRQHYGYINAGNYRAAWALLSPRFRSTQSLDGWSRGFRTTRQVQVLSADTISETQASAEVSITVDSVDIENNTTIRKRFQGAWELTKVDGEWRLDVARIRQVN